jgi:hypothetical protein
LAKLVTATNVDEYELVWSMRHMRP